MSDRALKLTSPAMSGPDVERFQRDINAELKRWGIDHALQEDGVYGPETRDTAKSVCYGLGLKTPVMENGATVYVRLKVRNRKLTDAELERFKARAEWRKRLKARYEGPESAVRAAVEFAIAHIGVTESPPGSNRGQQIDQWERACGFIGGPWCGAFANACLVAAGFPDQEWLRYCPWIEGKAKSGDGGWTWTQVPQIGDLVLYGTSIAQHVGIVEDADLGSNHGDESTIEGNTGTGPGGSQSNGGIVARRHRHTDGSLGGFPIRGYARPPWKKVA